MDIVASTRDQWAVLPPVLLGLLLTTLIGVEREVRAKSAGLTCWPPTTSRWTRPGSPRRSSPGCGSSAVA